MVGHGRCRRDPIGRDAGCPRASQRDDHQRGENVWPTAVEAVLSRHAGVRDVAVAGVPDAEWGERVVAYVVPSDDLAMAPGRLLAELRELVADELAGFAAPRQIVMVESVPRGPLGKVQRERLGTLEGESAGR